MSESAWLGLAREGEGEGEGKGESGREERGRAGKGADSEGSSNHLEMKNEKKARKFSSVICIRDVM